jgi:hypothetical protein
VENRVMAETVAAQPLADDVTAEELAARPEQPRAPRNKSTEEAYASSANKWWPMFLKAVCWDGTEKGVFIDAAGDPIDGTFSQLFIWLYEQDGMTKSIYKAMLAWAQARLNKQRAERLLAPMPGYVCNLPGIKERKSELFTGARESHMEHAGAVEPDAAEAAGLGMSPIAARLEHGDFAQAGPSRCQDRGTPRHHQPGWPSHSRAGSDAAAFSRAQTEAEDHRGERGCSGGQARPGGHPPVCSHIYIQFLYSIGPGGIPTYVLAPNKETVARLWEEYTTGLNGGPAVRNLIHDYGYGRKWHPPGDASRQLWRWHSYVYEEIERRMKAGESEVVAQ